MFTMLCILGAIFAVLTLIAVGVKISDKKGIYSNALIAFCYAGLIAELLIVLTAFFIYCQSVSMANPQDDMNGDITKKPHPSSTISPEAETAATEAEVLTPTWHDPRLNFAPQSTLLSNPDNFDMTWEINADGEIVDYYQRHDPICFQPDQEYFTLPGVSTFRGNNYRNSASYGTAVVEHQSMSIVWHHPIGSLNKWSGCAWTGQPLVVQWDEETKAIMNIYDSKKEKNGLVEVIYATLDGYIHFYDVEDGSETRKPINVGMNFKGSGTLDPRGYPLLYVGSGTYINGAVPRMFIVNLITGRIIYEYGHEDEFAIRDWNAFDATPLVDAETDTLIWPGENGVLYTIKLNTSYDLGGGTIAVIPDEPVKTRYTSYYSEDEGRSLGYESSPVVVDHFLFVSDNAGLFQCVDINTMELIWTQDLKDASCSSPVFEWSEDGSGYLYTATNLHWSAEGNEGSASIYKLDASTGEILWEYQRDCVRYDEIAGGIQCTPLLGKKDTNIEGLVIYSISRTPSAYRGVLVALDCDTGEKIWEISSGNYAWSSPAAFYTEDGHSYIFLANASGVARLIDGATGQVLMTLSFDETVEASPVIFNDMLVIGTREAVYGIKIS